MAGSSSSCSAIPPPATASVALIAGATGMAGIALAEALKSPTALGSPWTVYAAARRPPTTRYPAVDGSLFFDALDPAATAAAISPISSCVTHLFWVALAARETAEDNIAANSAMLSNVLAALAVGDSGRRSLHVTLQTGTMHYMGPFIDPTRIGRLEVPFHEDYTPRSSVPVFYHAQEEILADAATRCRQLTWTVHRSSIILGASNRSAYNLLLTVCLYALIARREGEPFAYPGTLYTWQHFCDASDAEVLAAQQIWAAAEAGRGALAAGEAFNCTNGDVFTWRSFWRAVAAEFGVEFVECAEDGEGMGWAERMRSKGPVWDEIVEENRLVRTRFEEITCFTAVCGVLSFRFQHVSSMNKSREMGFHVSVDTLKSVKKWIARLREMNIIPKN
ncbi:3-oxo-Delta(4,5)-steroid 5-beta-reductase [Apostasia shenzhenica]|uniref:3-oxo-Delta(4,5)-steroid 5-beta-reductase n=1 Tax=Apostasia shenzhenica TaxID=1088818 RepID=A0A2I0B3P5_9ASPA|nr:3-oxo-Delta(4,5)-steroid 5-beta-reductase [Apostasia shenzhenica]